jgi:hypothetical protein
MLDKLKRDLLAAMNEASHEEERVHTLDPMHLGMWIILPGSAVSLSGNSAPHVGDPHAPPS